MDEVARLHGRHRNASTKIERVRPDVVIVVGDDQHENLVDDNMPPFTIYMGETAEASVSLRYLKQPKSENRTRYQVHSGPKNSSTA